MAADLTGAVQKEELTKRGGRRSPALACRLLLGKRRANTLCVSPLCSLNNLTLSKKIKVLLFELLLETENTDVPTSLRGDPGSGCFGILMMTLKHQYSALQRLEELKTSTYAKKKKY